LGKWYRLFSSLLPPKAGFIHEVPQFLRELPVTLPRLMGRDLHRHGEEMLIVTIDMALKQSDKMTARCHNSACDWIANPLPAFLVVLASNRSLKRPERRVLK
jgi:hypothetical protein